MKATLEFNLDDPDDRKLHMQCVQAGNMASTLWEINELLFKDFTSSEDLKTALQEAMADVNLSELM